MVELTKNYIKSAFRLLIVNPADVDLLGIKFDNMYYIDKCLPMDCSVSCNLFEKFYIITFLGFIIDTVLMMVRTLEEKLKKIRNLLQPLLYKKKVSLKDLESLTGLMVYCSRAIPSSRAFIHRFYDLIAAVNNKKNRITWFVLTKRSKLMFKRGCSF